MMWMSDRVRAPSVYVAPILHGRHIIPWGGVTRVHDDHRRLQPRRFLCRFSTSELELWARSMYLMLYHVPVGTQAGRSGA